MDTGKRAAMENGDRHLDRGLSGRVTVVVLLTRPLSSLHPLLAGAIVDMCVVVTLAWGLMPCCRGRLRRGCAEGLTATDDAEHEREGKSEQGEC